MSAPAVVDRPLSIAEIVDRSITLTVKRWRPLAVLALILGIARAISIVVAPRGPLSALISGLAVQAVIDPLIIPAVVLIVAPITAPRLSVALRGALQRYGATFIAVLFANMLFGVTIGAAILVTLPVFMAHAPLFVFQTTALVLLTIFLSIPVLLAGTIYPIIVLETPSPWRAIAIGVRRMRNAGVWRSLRLGFMILALEFVPSIIANAVATRIDVLARMPATLPLEQALVAGITTVYIAALVTVISLEMRVRYEGSDIEAALETSSSLAGSKEPAVETA